MLKKLKTYFVSGMFRKHYLRNSIETRTGAKELANFYVDRASALMVSALLGYELKAGKDYVMVTTPSGKSRIMYFKFGTEGHLDKDAFEMDAVSAREFFEFINEEAKPNFGNSYVPMKEFNHFILYVYNHFVREAFKIDYTAHQFEDLVTYAERKLMRLRPHVSSMDLDITLSTAVVGVRWLSSEVVMCQRPYGYIRPDKTDKNMKNILAFELKTTLEERENERNSISTEDVALGFPNYWSYKRQCLKYKETPEMW